jgi:hypothetical protein
MLYTRRSEMAVIFLMSLNFHARHYQPIADFGFAEYSGPKCFQFQILQIPK